MDFGMVAENSTVCRSAGSVATMRSIGLAKPMSSMVLSNPTKDLQAQFINGNAAILNDPLLIDGFTNAVLIEDRGGAVKIDRLNRTSDHIDTSDALINAHIGAQFYFEDFKDADYNPFNDLNRDEKKDYFKRMFG